jgi:hypothetical protein
VIPKASIIADEREMRQRARDGERGTVAPLVAKDLYTLFFKRGKCRTHRNGGERLRSRVGRVFHFRHRFVGDAVEFGANEVGREAGPEEGAVDRGDSFVINFAAVGFQFAFDPLANQCAWVGLCCGLFERAVDDAVGNSAGAQFARNTEFALFARLRPVARELLSVALIVELAVFF